MKKSLLVSSVVLSLCFLSFIGNEAFALQYDTLYASDRNYLFTMDSATGIGTPVAQLSGFSALIDIAFLGTTLYANAYTGGNDVDHFYLYTIDPDTGTATLIGQPGYIIAGMTGGPDGYLYGAYKDLYRIDPSTGVATLIGSLENNQTIEGDIDFGPVLHFGGNGILYGTFRNGELATIDITTGTATMIGDIGFDGVINLAFKDGVLYGGNRLGQLFTIDTSTGHGTLVGTDGRVYLGGMTTSPVSEPISIYIKPGSGPNSINPKSKGKIPVAILSTNDFNAPKMVDRDSLTFGFTGYEDSLAFCNPNGEDIDGDGLIDLVCHFNTEDAAFECGDTEGALKGMTKDGTPIQGSDSVRINPCK